MLFKYWRIFSTGFCFFLFGLGGLVLSFIFIPVIRLVTPNKKHSELKVQRLIRFCFNLFCKIMKATRAIDYKITGAEILKEDKGCLIVANHPSLIDYVLIASQLKQCDCLVKAALWDNPFIKKIVQSAGYIPNKDPDDLIATCSSRLGDGNVLLIFPEGTRTTPGVKSKLQRGAAQIAVRTNTDIRVINITVQPAFLTKESKWYQVPSKKPFFHVEVKGRIEVEPFIQGSNNLTAAARKLNTHLEDILCHEVNEKHSMEKVG
ncbi:lysophospholipid acyltransferase family protein [Vibrio hannami]|uniref:lysophospholipid acyltransferase family protein n=1 Tax=Vibrio hannami TaxID=2717094 RepID=UPI0024102DAB|nr:lysophospholipid acyltransferase family protein [Vibrio hannami]MDG3087528.1 lysophospholipid acyltransferase family protein [Vibrio hannami]